MVAGMPEQPDRQLTPQTETPELRADIEAAEPQSVWRAGIGGQTAQSRAGPGHGCDQQDLAAPIEAHGA
ncbi:hypothetical protein D3C86_2186210 [compost metagenome]